MKIINVHIGEIHVARNGETLTAILGSCVGIALIWKARKMCAMAHCLLPEDPYQKFKLGARFTSQAVNSMMIKMKITQADRGEIEAVVIGGGNLTGKDLDVSEHIGSLNFAVAIRELKRANIRIIGIEKGGVEGRKISVHSETGAYEISRIARISNAG